VLDGAIETEQFLLKTFIWSLQVKPWTKELLQKCGFACFQLLSVLRT